MVSRRRFLTLSGGLAGAAAFTPWVGTATAGAAPISAQSASAALTAPIALTAADAAKNPGLAWPAGQVLPTFPQPEHLDVADVRKLSGDDQALLNTLQGIVNRVRPRVYFLVDDSSDAAWLATLGLPTTKHDDPMSLVAAYRSEISGAVVYDRDAPDSVNVATTLAGLKNAVIASPEQVEKYDLTIVEDLRGRFTDDPLATYRWQLEHLWPQCTHRLLTGVPPTRTAAVPGVKWTELARETNPVRDNSNRKVYELDLSPVLGGEGVYLRFQDAFGNDGWGPSVQHVTILADGKQIADFDTATDAETPYIFDADGSAVADGHRFCDGGSYWIYRFAPPAGTTTLTAKVDMWNQYLVTATDQAPTRVEVFPNLRDYIVGTKAMVAWLPPDGATGDLLGEIFGKVEPTTPYLGWFNGAVAGEHGGVGIASEHGIEVLAADFYQNGTVFSGARATIRPTPPRRNTPRLRKKIYVSFTVGEGDNIQYCQHRMRDIWDNGDRGTVPTNWTIDPLLADVGPAIYAYYQRTATGNDLLIAGPSGAGYTYPSLWPADKLDYFTKMTGRYMRATGLNVISLFNLVDGPPAPPDERVGASYHEYTPALGLILGWEHGNQITTPGGIPVVGDFARFADVADYHQGLYDHVADWDGDKPRFVAAAIQAWNWTPTQIVSLANSLDDRFEIVRGDAFFDLLRRTLD
ncbi:GxGYxY sequence motif-containing protein [Actinopolymorpha cephalotaxi]|uniref:GxGYxY sequence motif-containing protein n=1 Tax=Actinopolymorpha cephalotaxi TaxID=504797 RepID=A0A1I3B9J5_9ACTN|nr:GxGYxYP domain-containing protein [Actinopolymorpha cephalotaxi]NYH86811.1 hypothetical protein [Actinopolymorpha cephalotaxi]SFH58975.1 GxGYxY sequence motif-containing protein [Actinopolymorpha cephalotaxi]